MRKAFLDYLFGLIGPCLQWVTNPHNVHGDRSRICSCLPAGDYREAAVKVLAADPIAEVAESRRSSYSPDGFGT
jgi:hypothetical protein